MSTSAYSPVRAKGGSSAYSPERSADGASEYMQDSWGQDDELKNRGPAPQPSTRRGGKPLFPGRVAAGPGRNTPVSPYAKGALGLGRSSAGGFARGMGAHQQQHHPQQHQNNPGGHTKKGGGLAVVSTAEARRVEMEHIASMQLLQAQLADERRLKVKAQAELEEMKHALANLNLMDGDGVGPSGARGAGGGGGGRGSGGNAGARGSLRAV